MCISYGYGMMSYGFGGGLMMLLYYLILIGVVVVLALLIKKLWQDTQHSNGGRKR